MSNCSPESLGEKTIAFPSSGGTSKHGQPLTKDSSRLRTGSSGWRDASARRLDWSRVSNAGHVVEVPSERVLFGRERRICVPGIRDVEFLSGNSERVAAARREDGYSPPVDRIIP